MSQPKTWVELRAVVLFRDDYICQICKRAKATVIRALGEVPEDLESAPVSPVAQAFSMLARGRWRGGWYGYIKSDLIAKTSAAQRAEAEATYAELIAECDAVDVLLVQMDESNSSCLADVVYLEGKS